MKIRKCLKCMADFEENPQVCPVCGRAYGQWQAEDYALKPGSILEGKYLVGEMLGRGGFGITYLGYDLFLEQKVAIKEYFPMNTGLVTRDNRSTVVWCTSMMEKAGMEKSFDTFLKEARKMAKLGGIPGVVGVKSVFVENDTAYIVMDFVEGETLQNKLEREGPMDFETCVALLRPVMRALGQDHAHGIIHRDISPDNLMLQPDGKLILLDLGAAKELSPKYGTSEISSMLVAKHGFSPIEQYGRSGDIGPWTDVYAMAATIYYCCTGSLPPTAVDRSMGDTLTCRPNLTEKQFCALLPALAIQPGARLRDMAQLSKVLEHACSRKPEERNTKVTGNWLKRLVSVLGALAVLPLLFLLPKGGNTQKTVAHQTEPAQIQVLATEETNPPTEATEPRGTFTLGFNGIFVKEPYTKRDVQQIVFQSSTENARADTWNLTDDILAWMDGSILYVAAEGNISPGSSAVYLFESFQNLKEIDFGDCFDTSNVTNMNCMFSGCSNLTNLDVSGFDTSQVTGMESMFLRCESLENLDVSGFDTSQVTNMEAMFSGCSSLTSLDVSGLDTSQVTDMGAMFSGCSSLTSLDVSWFDTSKVTKMGNMFYKCVSLTSLDLSGFDTSRVTEMQWMFVDCGKLTSLDVSGFDTSQVTLMQWMFHGCSSLTSLDLSGFDTSQVTSMSEMFYGCSSLTRLDISGFDTSQVTNVSGMFSYCNNLIDFKCADAQLMTEYQNR